MELTLHTETTIDSCHQLVGYNGKCKNWHGHTWLVKVWFKGDSKLVDDVGILVDFGIVNEVKEWLDHKKVNDVIQGNPTAENISQIIYNYIKDKIKEGIKVKVRLYETAVLKKTYCECGDW